MPFVVFPIQYGHRQGRRRIKLQKEGVEMTRPLSHTKAHKNKYRHARSQAWAEDHLGNISSDNDYAILYILSM